MSKTDKTRPWWVRVSERPMVTCVPVHSHEDGVCTLPDDPSATPRSSMGFLVRECYWTESTRFLYGGGAGCGCAGCMGQFWRRMDRRAARRAGRQVCMDARRTYRTGDEEFEGYDDYVSYTESW